MLRFGGSMAGSLLPLTSTQAFLFLLLLRGDSLLVEPHLCDSSCSGSPPAELSYQRGVSYTYRYSTAVSTALHGSNGGRTGLALDCEVDISVVSRCHLVMQVRNSQIKRLSPQREHSVLHLKSLRESLERTRLKFSLQGGRVTALCLQKGEQVWALNIKRAVLSMLQTSLMVTKVREETETDVHGTCTSRYERRGPVLLKTKDLRQCHQSRLANLWPHSVALTEDTWLQTELRCVQRHGETVMEEVNCTEVVSMSGLVKTKTVSVLLLLRAQSGSPSAAEPLRTGVLTDLQLEDDGSSELGGPRAGTPQEAGQTVRLLCSLTSDPQLVSQVFLQLVFQLKDMNLSQLKTLWQEASFKCRNDWQVLLDALPACGSESCVIFLVDLIRNKELEEGQARSFLTALALVPRPSPQIVGSINALLEVPELQPKTLLAGSSLVYKLCKSSQTSCGEIPQVQAFMQTLENALTAGCEDQTPSRVRELLYTLKSIGNSGLSVFTPLLNRCVRSHAAALELRLAATQAFRRFPCSADRSVLLQLYGSSQEDPEVRIAAYQQLMLCPDHQVFEAVKTTLRSETSSQVGSFVWSHLTNVLRSEDPMKQTFIQSLPDDIISRDFEAEFWKYSSYSDHTFASDTGIKNVETSVIFSQKSFLPRSVSVNFTVYFHGRAHNLLEVELHAENAEPLLKSVFGHRTESAAENGEQEERRTRRKADDDHGGEKEKCMSSTSSYLKQARAMLFGRGSKDDEQLRCWVGVKVLGNELSVFSCEDIYSGVDQASLSLAELVVKLLKGHEVQLIHRPVLMTEELFLPSLSGLPIKLDFNMTSLLSLHLKGSINYKDTSHFSLNGYVRPSAYVGLSARMGVDSVLGQAAVEWVADLRSSTSLDGSLQLQEGRDIRVTLNTPQDLMDIISLSSRVFQLSGNQREEIKGPKSRVHDTTCTPKPWSKLIGWQLCSNVSYPSLVPGITLPPPGPLHLSVTLLKLDRGLHYYLLEAAYSLHHQRGSWLPREASIHLLLATPQSSTSRDMSLDVAFNPHRVLLRITHPLKTILVQGQLEQEKNIKSGKLEVVIDGVHYYVMGLIDSHSLLSGQRTRYHFEAKRAADDRPIVVSANVSRELGRKTSFSAAVRNVFREPASLSVALERRRDRSSSQYSVEAELLLPGLVGSRMLGLMEHRGSLWSSVLRLKYGLGGEARNLHQECYTSQRLRSGRDSNLTYILRADHEFYCSNSAPINHKVHFKHEESSSHIKSVLDMSYGKHWDEINNKHTLLLSQSFRNKSTHSHTSYMLEFNLQVPEKDLTYRTQLMHSHLMQSGSESSTHLKINYNNLMPLVAGIRWKSSPKDALQKKWEGTFTMDTPWLYTYTAHRLSRLHSHTLQLTSELTASRWLTVQNLVLESFYRDRGREKEARLEIYTPAVAYLQAGLQGVVGSQGVKASGSVGSLWTLPLTGNISLEASKSSHSLQISSTFGKQNVSLAAALNSADKGLKKKQVIVKLSWSKPKAAATEVAFEGALEELSRNKSVYQKTALLLLRQPLQTFPQSLLLRETFTVDLLKGLYILESKVGIHGNREAVHTLTLGYKPPNPFVCSALIHPFSSDTIPPDSEICLTATSNRTHTGVRGRLLLWRKERLNVFGQVEQNPLDSNQQAIRIRADFIHQLQLQLPSSAGMEADVCWNPKHRNGFDYQARGKLRMERQECRLSVQLSGTSGRAVLRSSLSHPFKSKIPKTLEVKATADTSEFGRRSSSVFVRADGKDRVMLNAHMSHFTQRGDRGVGLKLNLSQNWLPTLSDLHVDVAANVSLDSVLLRGSFTRGQEALLAQVKGSLKNSQDLQLAVSAELSHSMSSFSVLPSTLNLEGLLDQSEDFIKGDLRVRVMEMVHSIELRHHQAEAAEGLDTEEGMVSHRARDYLCVWSGVEHLCVNVSRLLNQREAEVIVQLSHSSQLLSATGVAANSSAQVKWVEDAARLSLQAELQAGTEHLKAELHRGRTDRRWQLFSRLQHRVKVLQQRGLSSSLQARAHYQLETEGLDAGLVLHMEDKRMADFLLNVGSKNKTAVLILSVMQQMKLLQEFIPGTLQVNCSGDNAADRLSAQCYGNVVDHPVEVRVFRSCRPHSRLCYGLSLTHSRLEAQAKGCYSPNGRAELRVNLTHPSVLLLTPNKSGLRLLLRPGPQKWLLGIGVEVGHWRTDLSAGLRLEAPGAYGWNILLEYRKNSVVQKSAVTGRVRMESWCDIRAEVGVVRDSVTSSLSLSVWCTGNGKLEWLQRWNTEGVVPRKTSLIVHVQTGRNGLRGSLRFENHQDHLQSYLSVLLKGHKAEAGWSFLHRRASVVSVVPNRVDLQGSGPLRDTDSSAQINISWEHLTHSRTRSQQSVTSGGMRELLRMLMTATASQVQWEVRSDDCSMLLLANQHKNQKHNKTNWKLFALQRCVLLKTLLPPQASVNISVTHSGCLTNLSTVLQAEGEQKGRLSLSLTRCPRHSLRASVSHSLKALKILQIPTNGALLLSVSTRWPGVGVDLQLGRCYLRGRLGSQEETGQSSYRVNVTSYCPSLQGTILPRSLDLQGLLSASSCQVNVSSSLRADSQDLSLQLSRSCRTPHLSGTFTHSFHGLKSQSVPQVVSVEAAAPEGPQHGGALSINIGTCYIRGRRAAEVRGSAQRLWAFESTCPVFQACLNGTVWQRPQGFWTVTLDTDVKGRSAFLGLDVKPWPELSVQAALRHDVPGLAGLPKRSRLSFTSRSGNMKHDADMLVLVEECAVRASGAAASRPGLQVSLEYHNNCTLIQEWGSPNRVQASGSLVVSSAEVDAHVSMAIDDSQLQTVLTATKTQFSHETTVGTTSETLRVKSRVTHTVNYLTTLGLPADNSVQVELDSAEGTALSLQAQCGGQQAGLRMNMRSFPTIKEVRAALWHSWSWAQDQGLPFNTEGLCSIKGPLSQLQSRVQLGVAGQNLLTAGLNVSGADGRLVLLLSYGPPAVNQTRTQHKLHSVLTAQTKGSLRSTSLDIHSQDWRLRAAGETGVWGSRGDKEARFTLKHTVQGKPSPVLQVEAWGRLTESQVKCSMAVNPELSSSLAVIVQGHHGSPSKDLMVNVVHNVPQMLAYLPSQLSVRSQLNRSESSVAGLVDVLSSRRRLWALGELALTEGGYRQAVEVKHSYPQLRPLPRTVSVRTLYEARGWSYNLQQTAVWGKHKHSLSALYAAPPLLDVGNQTLRVHIEGIPRLTSLEVDQERSSLGRLDRVLLGWTRHGQLEQVRALSTWSRSEERSETKLELKHPFSSTLSQLSLHTQSHTSQTERRHTQQTHLSLDGTNPVNVTLSLDKRLQTNSREGKACVLLSAQPTAWSSVKGCVSVGQQGHLYSQTAEITWNNQSFRQNMTYQKVQQDLHSLQIAVALDGASPAACQSHELLAKVQTDLRNRLEHETRLGACPQQPALWWSGSHRVNSGEEVFYTRSQLSVTGRPYECSFTLALINSSTAQRTNVSLFSEDHPFLSSDIVRRILSVCSQRKNSKLGNWSLEVGSTALSWSHGSGLQVQATLDQKEKIWLNGTLEGRCLQTSAGSGVCEELSVALCAVANHSLRMNVQRRAACSKLEPVGSVSLGTANQRLTLRASGCLESLTAAEEQFLCLSSQIQKRFTERVKTLQQLLTETREQSRDSLLLQELSAVALHASRQAEALLGEGHGGLLSQWLKSPVRHALTSSLPHLLSVLQQASLLGQQELRRPLATLAGVYQDVKGQRLELMWREAVLMWTDTLLDILPVQQENLHLRPLSQAGAAALRAALNTAVQQTYQWAETRLASVLSGVRKQLASLYRYSSRDCELTVSVPLPFLASSRVAEVGLLEVLLEEWLLRPLQALASVRPAAELYRLKRKLMDSPFRHEALLVADQFVVTFDGHLYELPAWCPLLLAQDVRSPPSFTLLLRGDAQGLLLVHLNNVTVNIQQSGQVKADCSAVAHTRHSETGLTVKRGPNFVQVANQDGQSVSCDLQLEVCSFTLDGWSHGVSTGLLGTNDNDAGTDFPLPDGSQAETLQEFFLSWQLEPKCSRPPGEVGPIPKAAKTPVSCDSLFSSPDSALSSCFRVVDPGQFLSVCESSSSRAPCRLARAFVHLCQQNYVPVEVPVQCMKL